MSEMSKITSSTKVAENVTSRTQDVQVAVFYFPQWHKTPGDDGDVFAEWKQIKEARPRFEGHDQPKIPLWGFCDEADPEIMAKKIDAAADHGIDVFIFDWYYHAEGKYKGTFLERALNEGFLKAPNNRRISFCLMWANHGLGTDSPGELNRTEFDKMIPHIINDYFTHPSYWKIDGKVVFSIYEIDTFIKGLGGLEGAAEALGYFNEQAISAGLKGVHFNIIDMHLQLHENPSEITKKLGAESVTSYIWVHRVGFKDFPATDYDFFSYHYFERWDREKDLFGVPYFPNVTMGWDPTPRMAPDARHDGSGYPNTPIISGNTPEKFRQALEKARERASKLPVNQRIITINAWNEWGEGSYLEPDTKNKFAYLEAIGDVFAPK
ncbi:glycoside hydrolase family 99-like domain-containing protein [Candidatus Sumerlaeota bacterium]|nr:glycoside hydrolase family 99-like domain-containing protein [Candidatus Sumerlaeota bacterium]